jgi:hypothetical protein
MSNVMVRYRVKSERAAENEQLVRAVYDELARVAPDGFRYATFVLEDGVTFVHIASITTAEDYNPLRDIKAFAEFQRDIASRCDEAPVVTSFREVGSFRFFV